VAKYPFHRSRGDRQTEDFLAMDAAVWTRHCPKSQDQDRDRNSRDPRPRPRPRLWGSKTKTETETRGFQDQDQDQDSEVPKRRPRPRLEGSKTKTETKTCKNESRDVSRPRLKSRELQVCYVVHFFLLEMEYSGAFVGHMHSAAYHVFYSCHEFTLFDVFFHFLNVFLHEGQGRHVWQVIWAWLMRVKVRQNGTRPYRDKSPLTVTVSG